MKNGNRYSGKEVVNGQEKETQEATPQDQRQQGQIMHTWKRTGRRRHRKVGFVTYEEHCSHCNRYRWVDIPLGY